MEGKVVYKGSSQNGKEILMRYPLKEDAKLMQDYINILSKERTFVRFQGEQITLNEEANYLDSQLQKFKNSLSVLLLVFCEENLIGISGIEMKDKIERHVGVFGISIAKDFRGEGIGTKLMELVISEAEKNLPALEIITLSLFANNTLAKQMYQEFGFVEYGYLPNGVITENGFIDHIYMYKVIRSNVR